MHISNSRIVEAFGFEVSSLFGRRQRRERARGLTDEKLKIAVYFKYEERRKLRREVSFPPRFLIAPDEQPVHATELESSSKNPQTHPEASSSRSLKGIGQGEN